MTEADVRATLEAIIGRVPEADALLDQLIGVRFESGAAAVTITCRPDAAPTQVADGPLPYAHWSPMPRDRPPARSWCGWRTATLRRRSTLGTPTIRRRSGPRPRSWSSVDWRWIAFLRIDDIDKRRDRTAHS